MSEQITTGSRTESRHEMKMHSMPEYEGKMRTVTIMGVFHFMKGILCGNFQCHAIAIGSNPFVPKKLPPPPPQPTAERTCFAY
jgi:hypothetical protein